MLEKGKRDETKENKSEELKEDAQVENSANATTANLVELIEKAAANLFYISETDAEISAFVGKQAKSVNRDTLMIQIESKADSPVEERNFTEFFARLTEIQDWFGAEETETASKFAGLKEVLENNLRDLKVFKVGKIHLDVYVVGLDAENVLLGVKTQAIET